MFSLHAITIQSAGGEPRTFFGKGVHDEAAVRSRLLPEHGDAVVTLCKPVEDRVSLDLRYLLLLEQLRTRWPEIHSGWWPVGANGVHLYMTGAMLSTSKALDCSISAEGMIRYRESLGLDQGVIAAMLGTERTRVHRLEQGKSKFTFDDYRRLRFWADRLNTTKVFMEFFPLGVNYEDNDYRLNEPEYTA